MDLRGIWQAETNRRSPELRMTSSPGASTPDKVGNYQIEGVLGIGGMGVVYQARNLTLKRTVALKALAHGRRIHAEELLRFRREAGVVARFQHPHIVQLFEFLEFDGQPYCVLEFVAGGNLAERLKETVMPARDIAGLVERLAGRASRAERISSRDRDLSWS